MYKKCFTLIVILVTMYSCEKKPGISEAPVFTQNEASKEKQEEIIEEHLKNGAWKYHAYSREWQTEIDKGLAKDSTIAYLWQQKAMPLFKQGKYEKGMEYIDEAVRYDRRRYQNYRAFIKCIFAKTHREAIEDFKNYKQRFGYGFVMDHSLDFYIGLSYLQLNEFEKAEEILERDYHYQVKEYGKEWLHHLDLFYYGISKYELKKYEEAITIFNAALEKYPQFSDVQVYKATTLRKLQKPDEAELYDELAEKNGRQGFSINEANSVYERYPYQIRW